MKPPIGLSRLSSVLRILSLLILPFSASAQLDSTVATLAVVPNYFQSADTLQQRDMGVLTLQFDDISDLGQLNVVVYNNSTNAVIGEYVQTRTQLQSAGFLLTDRVVWPLFDAFFGTSYRVEVNPQNLAGTNTRICSATVAN